MHSDEVLPRRAGLRAASWSRAGGGAVPVRIEVCLIMVLAGVLRFWTLGLQSYDFDEAFTVQVIHGSFTEMLRAVARSESTPPLYYVLAWIWARPFGAGEIGLRSLSALAGVALVPVVYALGSVLGSRRIGLVAAIIVATSPYLIFYSQEARSYALFALLSTAGAVCCACAIQAPTTRAYSLWAVVSVAALATHYFALFLWVGQLLASSCSVLLGVCSPGRAERLLSQRPRSCCLRSIRPAQGTWIGSARAVFRSGCV